MLNFETMKIPLMTMVKATMLLLIILSYFCYEVRGQGSRCGGENWFAYGDEKCFKISNRAASFYEAQDACKQLSLDRETQPVTLATIGSRSEHLYLDTILKNAGITVPVWIGLKRRLKELSAFEWIDGSDVAYHNWDKTTFTSDMTNYCGELIAPAGNKVGSTWSAVPCRKRNHYICQKLQRWSPSQVQEHVLRNRQMILAEKQRLNDYLATMKAQINNEMNQWKIDAEQQQVNMRKEFADQQQEQFGSGSSGSRHHFGIPRGFVYFQLPGQAEPKVMWPQLEWQDISTEYAGLFFRVLGGQSAEFGQVQDENAPKIGAIRNLQTGINNYTNYVQLSYNGQWTKTVWTGGDTGCVGNQYKGGRCYYGLQFTGTQSEVRPRNKAIRVWRRI